VTDSPTTKSALSDCLYVPVAYTVVLVKAIDIANSCVDWVRLILVHDYNDCNDYNGSLIVWYQAVKGCTRRHAESLFSLPALSTVCFSSAESLSVYYIGPTSR